ncbi:MAG: hypothetical protein QM286_12645 [Acidobacteriota bacterium]|nr:hypothetical protein [Acidobacteriota bacterium]
MADPLGHLFANPDRIWHGFICQRCGIEFRIWFDTLIDDDTPQPCI